MAGMGDMDMPGLGVMPVEVNGEEMLMTEVTQLWRFDLLHFFTWFYHSWHRGFRLQAGLIVDPATQAPVGVSHPQSNSQLARCKRSTDAEVEPSDRRGQAECTTDLHITHLSHFHLTNDPWHYGYYGDIMDPTFIDIIDSYRLPLSQSPQVTEITEAWMGTEGESAGSFPAGINTNLSHDSPARR